MITNLKIYITIFSITLLLYNIWSYLHIKGSGGLDKKTKIVATVGCMLFLGVAAGVVAYNTSWWKFFFIALPSIGVWATFTDVFQGTMLHKNPFYLGDSWPDSEIKRIVINGGIYTAFKIIYLIVTIPLLGYI